MEYFSLENYFPPTWIVLSALPCCFTYSSVPCRYTSYFWSNLNFRKKTSVFLFFMCPSHVSVRSVVRWSSKVRWSPISSPRNGSSLKIWQWKFLPTVEVNLPALHLDCVILVQVESICLGDNKVKKSLCHQSPHGWMQNSPRPGPAPVEEALSELLPQRTCLLSPS